ncbi:RNA ligase [Buchananella hordeovulneris]|uniref:RNA ligase n=1 Tax=Buchananella hordeovulneris TaxID=52770 RepID=UPI0026DC6D30|nr:RNA ligase [Buchananella hordeovulneris]MDO5079846.1 RNA ligase [Buchananella hordeovulneris]
MFVLRGAPGVGQGAALREQGLQELAVGEHDLLPAFSTPFTDLEGQRVWSLAHGAGAQVRQALRQAVELRLRLGGTLLLKGVHAHRPDWQDLTDLAQAHGYRVYVVNAQDGVSDEELLHRNAQRRGSGAYLEPAGVKALAARVRVGDGSVVEPVVDFADVRTLNTVAEVNVEDRYDRVVFIGDVQSCSGALAKLKEHYGGWDPRTLFVFVGDLFDRGPDAAGVAELIGVRPPDNVVLVEGNHDENLRFLLAGLPRTDWPDTTRSLQQLRAAGYGDDDIAALLDRCRPAVALYFASRHYLVTHAGLAGDLLDKITSLEEGGRLRYDFTEVPHRQLLVGSADRRHTWHGHSQYDRRVEETLSHPLIVQVHGHRNGNRAESPGPEAAAPNVWALEQRVEHGGHLAALEVDAAGHTRILRFVEPRPAATPLVPHTLHARLAAHPEVRIRPAKGLPGVLACTFTRRALAWDQWPGVACKARGLFLDERDSRVVARGYDAFFEVGQPPAPATLADVVAAGAGRPLSVRRKWNGYLALVAVIGGELRVLTKKGVDKAARHAEQLLREHLGETVGDFTRQLAAADVTLACEIITPRDPHLIDEGPARVVVLDAIRNEEREVLVPAVRDQLAAQFGFVCPAVEQLAAAADEATLSLLEARLARSEAAGDEGLVVTYGDGQRVKVKTEHFRARKALRALLRDFDPAHPPVVPPGPGGGPALAAVGGAQATVSPVSSADAAAAASLARLLADGPQVAAARLAAATVDGLAGPVLNLPALLADLP